MSADAETAPPPRRWLAFLPLAAFAASRRFFSAARSRRSRALPSALIGQTAPPLTLPGLDGAAGLTDADLRMGHVTRGQCVRLLVRALPRGTRVLMALAADDALNAKGVAIYGVAQKDSPENVRRFLGAKGDPYAKVGLDRTGAPASTGASTACRRPSSSRATERSPTRSSARSRPRRSRARSSRKS